MNRLLTFLVAVLAVISSQGLAAQSIPDVSLEDVTGHKVPFSSLYEDNLPVLLSFWGTYCKPCIMELDAISEYMDDLETKPDFKVVVVCTDDSRSVSKARTFVSSRDWNNFILLFDPKGELCHKFNITTIPYSFVFDKSGKSVYSHSGYVPGAESILIEKVKALTE